MAEMELWNSASLRISSAGLTVERITEILQTPPTRGFARGTLTSRRNPKSQIRTENLWILDSALPEGATLLERIDGLVRFLEARTRGFELVKRDASADVFCGFSCGEQNSISLGHHMMARLAALELDLVFDLYGGPAARLGV